MGALTLGINIKSGRASFTGVKVNVLSTSNLSDWVRLTGLEVGAWIVAIVAGLALIGGDVVIEAVRDDVLALDTAVSVHS